MSKTDRTNTGTTEANSGETPGLFTYFVSYAHGNNHGSGFGHAVITWPTPVTSPQAFNEFFTALSNNAGVNRMTVLSFHRIDNQ